MRSTRTTKYGRRHARRGHRTRPITPHVAMPEPLAAVFVTLITLAAIALVVFGSHLRGALFAVVALLICMIVVLAMAPKPSSIPIEMSANHR